MRTFKCIKCGKKFLYGQLLNNYNKCPNCDNDEFEEEDKKNMKEKKTRGKRR
ncbi:MAG: hypothetical protein OEL89_04415 [Candidatus Peregrinibacteria bacterium]|nr:hypothetical protein [Candidatus Peregrinibacteria bacterium]